MSLNHPSDDDGFYMRVPFVLVDTYLFPQKVTCKNLVFLWE